MTKTTTELADAVLQDLAIAAVGETPDTEHRTYVTDAYASWWEEMNAHGRELVYWPQAEIPLPVFHIVRDMVALEVGNAFGKTIPPEAREQRRDMIMKRLYRHTSMQSSGLDVSAVYY